MSGDPSDSHFAVGGVRKVRLGIVSGTDGAIGLFRIRIVACAPSGIVIAIDRSV